MQLRHTALSQLMRNLLLFLSCCREMLLLTHHSARLWVASGDGYCVCLEEDALGDKRDLLLSYKNTKAGVVRVSN